MEVMETNKLTLKEYIKKIKQDYRDYLKDVSNELIMADSYTRDRILADIIKKCTHDELKYYLFYCWWDSVDAGHHLFTPTLVAKWLKAANVELNLDKLKIDDDGFITVYRGENQHSFPYKKGALSWTTSKLIAKKFAKGLRLRTQAALAPKIIKGRVKKSNILAVISQRDERKLLCRKVIILEELKL